MTKRKIQDKIQIEFPIVNCELSSVRLKKNQVTPKVVNNDSFDYKQIKFLAGQGAICMMLKGGYDFMFINSFDDEGENANDLSTNKQNSDNEDRNIA